MYFCFTWYVLDLQNIFTSIIIMLVEPFMPSVIYYQTVNVGYNKHLYM